MKIESCPKIRSPRFPPFLRQNGDGSHAVTLFQAGNVLMATIRPWIASTRRWGQA